MAAEKTFRVRFVTKGAKAASRALKKAGSAGSSAGKTIKKAGAMAGTALAAAGTAATAAAGALGALVAKTSQYAKEVDRAAQNSGFTAESIQEIAYAAKQTSGANFDQVSDGLKELSLRSAEAAQGTGEAQEAFERLGISQQTLQQASPEELFARVQERMKGLTKQQRILTAEQVFGGEAGEYLAETMGLTAEEMASLSAQAKASGKVLTGSQVQALERARASYEKIKGSVVGLGRQIVVALLPVLERIAPLVEQAVTEIRSFTSSIDPSTFTRAFGVIRSGFQAVRRVVEVVVADVVAVWTEWRSTIVGQARNAMQRLRLVISGALATITGIWDVAIGALTGDWARLWDGVKSIVVGGLSRVVGIIANGLESILELTRDVASRIPKVGEGIAGKLDDAAGAVRSFREEMQALAEAQSDWSGLFEGAGGAFGGGGASGGFSVPDAPERTDRTRSGPMVGRAPERPRAPVVSSEGGETVDFGPVDFSSQLDIVTTLQMRLQEVRQQAVLTWQQVGGAIRGGVGQIANGLADIVTGFDSVGGAIKDLGSLAVNVFKSIIKQIVAATAKALIFKAIAGIASGGSSFAVSGIAGGILGGVGGAAKAAPAQIQVTGKSRTQGGDLYTSYQVTGRSKRRAGIRTRY